MANKVFIKNTTAGPKTWVGNTIKVGQYYEITPEEQRHWTNSSKVTSDISDGTLVVSKDATAGGEISDPVLGQLWLEMDHRTAFEGELISLGDKIVIAAGSIAPDQTVIKNAPVGSRFFRDENSVYRKVNTGDLATDWELITSGDGTCQVHLLRKENCGRELMWEVIDPSDLGSYDTNDFDDVFMTCADTTVSYTNCELILTTT